MRWSAAIRVSITIFRCNSKNGKSIIMYTNIVSHIVLFHIILLWLKGLNSWLLVVGMGCVFCAGTGKVLPSPSNLEEGGREKVCRKEDDWLVNRILWLII